MNFVNENRIYFDDYLVRITQCELNNHLDLKNLLNKRDFWKIIQKKEKILDSEYLGLLFNFENIKVEDFKKFNKTELLNYVENFILSGVNLDISVFDLKNKKVNFDNADDLIEFCKNNSEEKRQEIKKLKGWFTNFKYSLSEADKYFLLNKEWFELGDYRVFEREFFCYPVYVFIIWFIKNSVFTCELSWD